MNAYVPVERRAAALTGPKLLYPCRSTPSDAQRSYAACPLRRKLGALSASASNSLAKHTHRSSLRKSQTTMSDTTDFIVYQSVRPELRTTLANRPLLGCFKEHSTDAESTSSLIDIPSLQIRHITCGATVHYIANGEFHKSDGRAIWRDREKNLRRLATISSKIPIDVFLMVSDAAVRP